MGVCMNDDIETIREELNADDHNERTLAEANAALDRLETELNRLHAEGRDSPSYLVLQAENERLREELYQARADAETLAATYEAENEGLRELTETGPGWRRAAAQREEALQAEVERLRVGRRAALTELLAAKANVKQLAAENEKLRAHQERTKTLKKQAEAEVERLRAYNKDYVAVDYDRLRRCEKVVTDVAHYYNDRENDFGATAALLGEDA